MNFFSEHSDEELIRLLNNDSQEAFEELYHRHWFHLYQSAFYILQEKAASKDVVQDIFIWLWENRTTLHISNVKGYLKASVRFKVANYIRSGNIRESFFNAVSKLNPGEPSTSTDDDISLKELQNIIHKAILQLPDKCREVYLLSRDEGLTNRQIAERLGISIKTVEAQMSIALKRLRSTIGVYLILQLIWFISDKH